VLRCAFCLHFVALSMPGKLQLMNAIPRHRKPVLNRAWTAETSRTREPTAIDALYFLRKRSPVAPQLLI
jgi:hypothetical protein